jgi:hypothetical protein
VGEWIKAMRDQEMPVDFDQSEMDWVRELRQSNSDFFRDARIRYGVTLLSGKVFLGMMTLSEKITKEHFSLEDFDLLKTISDQAAGSIQNIKISNHVDLFCTRP